MKTYYTMPELPASGVQVTLEGTLTRLLFDFKPATPFVPEGEEAPENEYECYGVDVNGRQYGDIVSAIINDKYPRYLVDAVNANHELAKDENSDITPEKRAEYLQEYDDFQNWRKKAKEIATIVVSLIEG